ncbi:MAG: geranylgeranylglycerol-phosphate geranylgeranyltransferase [Candidatus Aenigmatarchaeota archaeon]
MSNLLPYMELLRPVNGAMAIAGVIIGAALGGVGFMPPPTELLIAALVSFLISGAGMTLNDYFDFRIDFMNRPNRPLPSGRISTNAAMSWAAILYGTAIGFSVFALPWQLTSLAAMNILATFLYAWWLKRTAVGNFMVSWLVASTFIFGAMLGVINPAVVAVAGMAFTINLSREIIKSLEDVKGDKVNGAKTFVVAIGRDAAEWASLSFLFIGIGMSIVPYVLGQLKFGYLLLIIPSDLLAAWAGWQTFENTGKAQKYVKYAMILALVAFALGLVF